MPSVESPASLPISGTARKQRIAWIDIARGIALVAMASYHFCWDLEFFGYLEPGSAGSGPLKWYARGIASSFLILVGISLVLAHGNGIRWKGFGRRLAMVAAAALAITIATWFATPASFIFFGILHQIAVASLLGLAFLRLPATLLAVLAVAWFSVFLWAKSDFFAHPALLWVGLSPLPPHSNDYVPLFPWFSAVLAGMAIGRHLSTSGRLERLARRTPGDNTVLRGLGFLGRHSLATYLIHQPVLIAAVYLFSLASPPVPATMEEVFVQSCVSACRAQASELQCTAYCECVTTRLVDADELASVYSGNRIEETAPLLDAISGQCSVEAGFNGN
ncbi:heparan-alpha-glucosaminide N-acetyltransferase [Oricola thermophila]|uniref:DUF1624 domain-containing protein n=1 Tax=Oricola thermophila TaxID=2742145 RepID=A0A6N1VAV6_9HYPH|nr:DUF1624 domain-containing protein [Oricola thermophila]QKV18086.1 DUF1624 domain-containing protein [Oricola thermophila]